MVQFSIICEFEYEEPIASLDIADLNGNGIEDIILTTSKGALRVLNYSEQEGFNEIYRLENMSPIVTLGHGRIISQDSYDFVLGHEDDCMRIVTYKDNEMEISSTIPLGSMPTSICVLNVVGDPSAEVVVSTKDKTLRCYGWFDVALDKLAHKVIDQPTYMMMPLNIVGVPYSRIIFGDDTGFVYIYQYADDRLHEISKAKAKGNVRIVASGDITGNTTEDIVTVSDGRNIALFRYEHPEFKRVDTLKASSPITSVRISEFLPDYDGKQILLAHDSSTIALLNYEGNRLNPITSTRTAKKSVGSFVAHGNLTGNNPKEIVQAVGNSLYLLKIEE
jgi:WD40 repeat protein